MNAPGTDPLTGDAAGHGSQAATPRTPLRVPRLLRRILEPRQSSGVDDAGPDEGPGMMSRLLRRPAADLDAEQIPTGAGVGVAMRAVASWSARFLLIVAALFVLWRILDAISLVTITVTVAVMISAVLRPWVNLLARSGVPRWLAATFVFLLGVVAIGALTWFVIAQITDNADTIGLKLNQAVVGFSDWLQHGPARLSDEQVAQYTAEIQRQLTNAIGGILSGAYATATSIIGVLSGIILCLFALLFLLLDDGAIWRWVVSLFPANSIPAVQEAGRVAWRTLVAYMRSTVFLAVINALTMVVIMMIANIELVVPLGVLLFLGSLIPLVGMLVAGAVLVLVAWVMNGPVVAMVMLVSLFLTVQLEGNLLNPYILGKAVNIHPLAILATVTGGTLVGGIFGAFTAVPLVAIINNVATAMRPEAETPVPLVDDEAIAPD